MGIVRKGTEMKVTYYDGGCQCTIEDNADLLRGLDSAAQKYFCFYCHGGITVQRVGEVYRLWCLRCGVLDKVASRYAVRSSRVIVVKESGKKSQEDLLVKFISNKKGD